MKLIPPTQDHLATLMTWFPTMEALTLWSGPNFRIPFTTDSFVEDLKLDSIASYSLIQDKKFIGFGQYYERLGHIHLARLIINPQFRGRGHINALVNGLIALGKDKLALDKASLFVMTDNPPAVSAYQKLGFAHTVYPESMPMVNIHYMTKSINAHIEKNI